MKTNIKIILAFIAGICISVLISVTASTIINSKSVFYNNDLTGLTANVQDAIDETYTKSENLKTQVSELEEKVNDDLNDYIKITTFVKSATLEPNIQTKVEIPITLPEGYKYVSIVNNPTYSNIVFASGAEGYSSTKNAYTMVYLNTSSSAITFNARVTVLFIKDIK